VNNIPHPIPPGLGRIAARIAHIRARFRHPRSGFRTLLASTHPPGPADLRKIVAAAAARHGIAPDLLVALAEVESNLTLDAVSPKGALGIMQLMPDTARRLGLTNPFDPHANADAGARCLREHLDRFGGDIALALAAYNAGPAAVARFHGIPPYRETQSFVSRVLSRLPNPLSGASTGPTPTR